MVRCSHTSLNQPVAKFAPLTGHSGHSRKEPLGFGLISHHVTMTAMAIVAMKALISRSKSVATRRQSLKEQNMRSTTLRCRQIGRIADCDNS